MEEKKTEHEMEMEKLDKFGRIEELKLEHQIEMKECYCMLISNVTEHRKREHLGQYIYHFVIQAITVD